MVFHLVAWELNVDEYGVESGAVLPAAASGLESMPTASILRACPWHTPCGLSRCRAYSRGVSFPTQSFPCLYVTKASVHGQRTGAAIEVATAMSPRAASDVLVGPVTGSDIGGSGGPAD